jgi:hypothetical protein
MDLNRFDALSRSVATLGSRRSLVRLLAAVPIVGGLLASLDAEDTVAKTRQHHQPHRKHGKNKRRNKKRNKKHACYPGTSCSPGAGQDTSGCDFSRSTLFVDRDVRDADLSNSSFFAADLRGADFRGASLRGGCFLAADLRGATIDASVNLQDAIFCETVMPDGSVNSSGCDQATGCCSDCPGGVCGGWDGCTPIENICTVFWGRPCCPNSDCEKLTPSKFSPTTCQSASCRTTAECSARFPNQDVYCETDTFKCPGARSSCCLPKTCDFHQADRDCPHSGNCCGFVDGYHCCAPGQLCSVTGCYGATHG